MTGVRYYERATRSMEYFCNKCGRLRISPLHNPVICLNCGSDNIIVGRLGSLDKAKLKEEFDGKS